MSSTTALEESATAGVDIDALFEPTCDEIARAKFISVLRNYTKTTMRDTLENHCRTVLLADLERAGAPAPTSGEELEALYASNLYYRVYSSVRYNAQKMMFLSAIDPVERRIHELADFARRVHERRAAGGTLELDPALAIPKYVTALDVHLVPGGFHSEYIPDDVAQGMIVSFGGRVSTGANEHRKDDLGGVGRSVGYWVTQRWPHLQPRRVLDLGTQAGKNLRPYVELFPDAEVHGIDVCAPSLRYGHVKAECAGQRIHFSQQNAEQTRFPDASFDLIVSSFFFHEIPLAATRRVLRECHRLLAPGGVMVHMELPPRSLCTPFQNFYWDWDAQHNNEPFYVALRSQDLPGLMAESGFEREMSFMTTIPNMSTFGADRYVQYMRGEIQAPLHGRGGWFVFGARK
jgi:SAM-dependent methyltransferase